MKYFNARCKIQLDLPVKFAKAIPVKFATVIPAILTGNEKGVESAPQLDEGFEVINEREKLLIFATGTNWRRVAHQVGIRR